MGQGLSITRQSDSEPRISHATIENARYSLDKLPTPDHPNEDRYFVVEEDLYKIFGVFDGHDGSRGVEFASDHLSKLFQMPFWKSLVCQYDSGVVCEALEAVFLDTEKEFFGSMEESIQKMQHLQDTIPQHLTSYEAYLQYPNEVQQLQEVQAELTGGCTAVVAVIIKNTLYVANVGDSRAMLVREDSSGMLVAEQLTVDHTVENEEEQRRLARLGLEPEDLVKAGRLGTQENTRSIGDYSIKAGYRDVDTIRNAISPPGIAVPSIMNPRELDPSCKYLMLMTDGVYKSIENTVVDQASFDVNKIIVSMIQRELRNVRSLADLASFVLERIAGVNKDTYMSNANIDIRSPLAVSCRKRDDMTLIICALT